MKKKDSWGPPFLLFFPFLPPPLLSLLLSLSPPFALYLLSPSQRCGSPLNQEEEDWGAPSSSLSPLLLSLSLSSLSRSLQLSPPPHLPSLSLLSLF